jgi:hypothetical protein
LTALYFRDGLTLVASNRDYITVIAPAVGMIIGSSIEITRRYRIKRRKTKGLNPTKTININGNSYTYTLFARAKSSLVARKILFLYNKMASISILRSAGSSWYILVESIVIVRSVSLIVRIVKYHLRTRENVFKIIINTLMWIAYSTKRARIVNLGFISVVLLTTKLWCASSKFRTFIRIWTCVTFLNLSVTVGLAENLIQQRPSNIGAFGLPIIERPIQQLNSLTENVTNTRISMSESEKEDKLILSMPLQDAIPKGLANDIELETNQIIQNSILGEENSLLPKQEGLQKGETRRTNSTSRPKNRTNSLQNLTNTPDNVPSLTAENELENFSNTTQIKAEKVQ